MSSTCFCIGHHDAPAAIYERLFQTVCEYIDFHGVTHFVVGHYGNFDHLAAKAIRAAKESHPFITLTLLLPYHPAIRPMEKPAGFDDTFYPFIERVPARYAIVKANQYMIRHCSHFIVYAAHPGKTQMYLNDILHKNANSTHLVNLFAQQDGR